MRVDLEGKKKSDYVKQLHEKVRLNIEKRNEQVARNANRGRVRVVFEPGDWVWVHFRKERFPNLRKSKLSPRGGGPFQVLERVNDNAYKLDLPSDYYNVSATFNVADLSPFDFDEGLDSRTNPFEEGGNDAFSQGKSNKDPLQLQGPITRGRLKKFKDALGAFIQGSIWKELAQTDQGLHEAQMHEDGSLDSSSGVLNLIQWSPIDGEDQSPTPFCHSMDLSPNCEDKPKC